MWMLPVSESSGTEPSDHKSSGEMFKAILTAIVLTVI